MDTEGKTIDDEIENALKDMERYSVGTEEYLLAAKAVDMLCQARSHAKASSWKGIPLETLIVAGTNILGILLVLNHERLNVITTKAFGMISRSK